MIHALLFLWIASAFLIIREKEIVRLIIYLAVFSLITSLCFLLFSAPDVAIAEAVISTFSTIIFIVAFEKYRSRIGRSIITKKTPRFIKHLICVFFCAFLFVLFVRFIPDNDANSYLKDQYISMFSHDIGGENAVTAIYLGYRVYDTLFEALMLLASIVAVIHLSEHQDTHVPDGKHTEAGESAIAVSTIRIICPLLVLFGIYLKVNGHLSPGGGFQGGVVVASFFMCRYMIHTIHDIPIRKVIILEKIVYVGIILLAAVFIFLSTYAYLLIPKNIYLIIMNLIIGMKVVCGFLVIFYRFIVFEWR